ncbi:MAG: hypothetical protein ABJL17_01605 [Parvibaculum sp.]|uniref:hypothetical protein n=1 Tax=Parvibaculum sp. TaxID=2024848 RepID=UPI003265B3BB
MANSKQIAAVMGPTLIVLSATEAINLHIWATNIAPVTYLNGTILFVAGLAIVRFHNVWMRGWPTIVTMAGWILLLAGLFRMFAPEAPQAGENIATYAMLGLLFAFGSILTLKAYSREK